MQHLNTCLMHINFCPQNVYISVEDKLVSSNIYLYVILCKAQTHNTKPWNMFGGCQEWSAYLRNEVHTSGMSSCTTKRNPKLKTTSVPAWWNYTLWISMDTWSIKITSMFKPDYTISFHVLISTNIWFHCKKIILDLLLETTILFFDNSVVAKYTVLGKKTKKQKQKTNKKKLL